MNRPKMSVILEKDPRFNVKDAARYGELSYLYEPGESKPSVWAHSFIKDVQERLSKIGFDPAYDYFVVTGQQIPVVLAIIHLVSENESVNLLFFDSANNEYVHKVY